MSNKHYEKPSAAELEKRLTRLQWEVTQNAATEPPFRNEFWDNHEPGLYVDVATGEPLFSSTDKFDSGTGWPSFTQPVEPARVIEHADTSHGMTRLEVRSQGGGSHLGHVFDDGPAPTRARYCINSAALRFVPATRLVAEGYGEYAALFGAGAAAPAATANSCTVGSGSQPGCAPTLETAILAGGCFWGMEEILRKIPGVLDTEAVYTGGTTPNPTYEDLHDGTTGHAEAVKVIFDPQRALVRRSAREVVLPHARPDDEEPARQRRRLAVSLGDFRDVARAAEDRRGSEGARRRLGQVEASDRHRDRRCGPGDARGGVPPGLLGEASGRVHLSLHA